MKLSSSSKVRNFIIYLLFIILCTSGKFPLRSETSYTLLFCFPGPVNALFGFTLTTGRRYFCTRQLKARQFSQESLRTKTGRGEPL